MAHVFILLSFWEDPETVRWNGIDFTEWHGLEEYPPPLKLNTIIEDTIAPTAETWLREILGKQPEDLHWFQNPQFPPHGLCPFEALPKPSGALDDEDVAEVVEHIRRKDWAGVVPRWQSDIRVWLGSLEIDGVYGPPLADPIQVFLKHKATTVELT